MGCDVLKFGLAYNAIQLKKKWKLDSDKVGAQMIIH